MTALETYRAQYEEERTWYVEELSKYKWVASRIFDLTTYDGELDEFFVKTIIEVSKVILDRRNYEYIEDENNYIKYILVCQILNNFQWIDWGTSIRGAWFERQYGHDSRDILELLEWTRISYDTGLSETLKIESVPFTVENLKALIEFMEE